MKNITDYIESKKHIFYDHAIFDWFRNGEDIGEILEHTIGFGFWIMTFQDVLRLNTERFSDEKLKSIAETHMQEDSGHDLWYLSDLTMMGLNIPTISTIYDKQYESARDASYLLLNEVLNATSDFERLILIEAIESTSDVFFSYTSEYIDKKDLNLPLRFFSKHHFNVEQAHDCKEFEYIFEATKLNREENDSMILLVDRVYDAFDILYTGIDELMKMGIEINKLSVEKAA